MFTSIYHFISGFFRKSRTIDNEPLNKVSVIIIVLIDIFILVNVFSGLDDISRWYISPNQTYPCYSEWQNYRQQNYPDKDYRIINAVVNKQSRNRSFVQEYQQNTDNHLGKLDSSCLNYAKLKDSIRNPDNKKIVDSIDSQNREIFNLEKANKKIKSEYDSTLLEKIAGQPEEKSLNSTSAAQAKEELEQNNNKISQGKTEITKLKQELLSKTESQNFLSILKNEAEFNTVKEKYDRASFWHSSIKLGFQSLFLLPLIFLAALIHRIAQHKRWGLTVLISWHLLVIFCIPLIFKLFEFLQIGVIFRAISDFLQVIFLNLLFLVHYVYILLIPLIGFGLIKLFQKIVFNTKVQAAKRVQKSRCIKCAKKIKQLDSYCPHCGYYQYIECVNCHQLTYKYLPHCNQCGHIQDSN